MTTIDPLKVLITHADNDPGLTALIASRVAMKHRYAGGDSGDWSLTPHPQKALTLRFDGGPADLYTPRQTLRVEARCYGEDEVSSPRTAQACFTI
jgi:hypothetical protein